MSTPQITGGIVPIHSIEDKDNTMGRCCCVWCLSKFINSAGLSGRHSSLFLMKFTACVSGYLEMRVYLQYWSTGLFVARPVLRSLVTKPWSLSLGCSINTRCVWCGSCQRFARSRTSHGGIKPGHLQLQVGLLKPHDWAAQPTFPALIPCHCEEGEAICSEVQSIKYSGTFLCLDVVSNFWITLHPISRGFISRTFKKKKKKKKI